MKPKTKAITWGAFILSPLAMYFFLGEWFAGLLANAFGEALSAMADGKFSDPVVFVHGRIKESVEIIYATIGICSVTYFLGYFWRGKAYAGLLNGLVLFLGLNVLALLCGNSVLVCSLFYDEEKPDNFAQYQIKRKLLSETGDKQRVILIGNSQTNVNIDESLLNQAIGEGIWTTELTQPGTRGFDMLVLSRDIPLQRGDWVVTYFSEIVCYGGTSGIVVPRLLHFRDLDDIAELDGLGRLYPGALKNGILGRMFPLFRFQESLSRRVLGPDITNMGQFRFDTSEKQDTEEMARQTAASFSVSANSEFEKNSVMRMAEDLKRKGCILVIIKGDVNPAMARNFTSELRRDMEDFYAKIEKRFPETLITVEASEFLEPIEGNFSDMVHSTKEAQTTFTKGFAGFLKKEISERE